MNDDRAVANPFVDESNVFVAMAALVGERKRVLDLGRPSDYFAKLLARRSCEVVRAPIADIDQNGLSALFRDAPRFDVIVCGEALEALREPLRMLEDARSFLAEGGYVVASVLNVAHGAVRLSLLAGSFDYQEFGVLDAAHVRFFTRKSAEELFIGAGFHIGHIERMRQPIFEESALIPRLEERDCSREAVAETAADPESDTRQFVFQAFPLTDEERLRSLSQMFRAANTELAVLRRRAERREREAEHARARAAEAESALREAREHLRCADEEMRRAQASHALLEREWLKAAAPLSAFEQTRAERDRLLSERVALFARLTEVERGVLTAERRRAAADDEALIGERDTLRAELGRALGENEELRRVLVDRLESGIAEAKKVTSFWKIKRFLRGIFGSA